MFHVEHLFGIQQLSIFTVNKYVEYQIDNTMKILNDLILRFEKPLWAKAPEFAVIDTILENNPHIIEIVAPDVMCGLENNNMGRKDNPTVEQILRIAIYKELRGLTYEELEFHQYDSQICKEFIGLTKGFSDSCLQEYISKIQAENLTLVMIEINKIAALLGYEDFKTIRIDSTSVEADVQRPTNNSLVYDCIKTASLFFAKIKEEYAEKYEKIEAKRAEAKKINYELNNVRGKKNETHTAKEAREAKMKSLFTEYLDLHQTIHADVKMLIDNGLSDFTENDQEKIIKLENNMSIVYNNAYRFQIEGIKVENEEKIFSIYEAHTDIIVKGLRDIIYGHKVNLATGKSNLILFCNIEDGNPSDKNLFEEPILTIKSDYDVDKFTGCATDGGYASTDNMNFAKEHVVNVVFTKVVGSLKNIVENVDIENALKKWRAGIEGNISNLKRKFKLKRVTWKGKALFDAKVLWSVVAYNIRVLTGHILGTLKTC